MTFITNDTIIYNNKYFYNEPFIPMLNKGCGRDLTMVNHRHPSDHCTLHFDPGHPLAIENETRDSLRCGI